MLAPTRARVSGSMIFAIHAHTRACALMMRAPPK